MGDSRPIWYKKSFLSDDLTVGNVAGAGAGFYLQFQPNQLPAWSTYAALYEQFYLKKINVRIEPTFNGSLMVDSVAGAILYIQNIHSTIDQLNLTPPTNGSQLINDSTYKRTRNIKVHSRTFYPKMQMDINESVIDTDTTLINKWMSTTNTADAYYYGLRVYIDPVSSVVLPSNVRYNVFVTYTMGFKGLKV